jgi:hypothetical protein
LHRQPSHVFLPYSGIPFAFAALVRRAAVVLSQPLSRRNRDTELPEVIVQGDGCRNT